MLCNILKKQINTINLGDYFTHYSHHMHCFPFLLYSFFNFEISLEKAIPKFPFGNETQQGQYS